MDSNKTQFYEKSLNACFCTKQDTRTAFTYICHYLPNLKVPMKKLNHNHCCLVPTADNMPL